MDSETLSNKLCRIADYVLEIQVKEQEYSEKPVDLQTSHNQYKLTCQPLNQTRDYLQKICTLKTPRLVEHHKQSKR